MAIMAEVSSSLKVRFAQVRKGTVGADRIVCLYVPVVVQILDIADHHVATRRAVIPTRSQFTRPSRSRISSQSDIDAALPDMKMMKHCAAGVGSIW